VNSANHIIYSISISIENKMESRIKQFLLHHFLWLMGAIACIGLVVVGLSSGAYASASEIATGSINYQTIAPLQQSMPFPMRLPRVLVYANNLASAGQFFATGGVTTDSNQQWTTGYDISILDSPNCRGGLICTIAYASAEVITEDRLSIEAEYAWMMQPGGLDAYLAHAGHAPGWVNASVPMQQVYLVPWVNGGAGMGYEQAVWDEASGGIPVRYTIGLKGGDATWLIAMVESIYE
jgi:hypothetical protein